MFVLTTIIYASLLLLITNYSQIALLINSFLHHRNVEKHNVYSTVQPPFNLQSFIKKKTGISIKHIRTAPSTRPFAMIRFSIKATPYLLISNKILEDFSEGEIQYVLLHESGHYKFKHEYKLVVLFVILLTLSMIILYFTPNRLLLFLPLNILSSIIYIQYARKLEIDADRFAVQLIDNPADMISATKKFFAKRPKRESLMQKLFSIGLPYKKRIEIAKHDSPQKPAIQRI